MVRYKENQLAPTFAWIIVFASVPLAATGIALAGDRSWIAAIILTVSMGLLVALLFKMTTLVQDDEVEVTFGYVPCYRKRVKLQELAKVEATQYDPMREYGGWGIKGTSRNRVLSQRGNLGVLLTYRDGRKLLIGSARPDLLVHAISQALK